MQMNRYKQIINDKANDRYCSNNTQKKKKNAVFLPYGSGGWVANALNVS